MYTVDQQINSSGPWIYLSCFSVANILMCLDRLGVFTYLHLLPFPWELSWNIEQFHLFLWRESCLLLLKYFMRCFLLIPKATVLQLLSWIIIIIFFFARLTMRLVPLNHEAWEYSFQDFICFYYEYKMFSNILPYFSLQRGHSL